MLPQSLAPREADDLARDRELAAGGLDVSSVRLLSR
jgi:hypothetical protein